MGRNNNNPAAILKMTADEADMVVAALRDWADAEEDDPEGVLTDVELARRLANRVEASERTRKSQQERNARLREQSQRDAEAVKRGLVKTQGTATSRAKFATAEDADDPDLVTILL